MATATKFLFQGLSRESKCAPYPKYHIKKPKAVAAMCIFVTFVNSSRGMSIVISCVRDFVCLLVCMCPHSKRKMARAINTKVGRLSACIQL